MCFWLVREEFLYKIAVSPVMSLDIISLTNVLEQANGSERGSAQKLAENQLKEWEVQPGFHYLLQVSIDWNLALK